MEDKEKKHPFLYIWAFALVMIPTSIFAYDLGGVVAVVIWGSPYFLIKKMWENGRLRYFPLYVISAWALLS